MAAEAEAYPVYYAGRAARTAGARIEQCPHDDGTADAIVWRKGWRDMDREIAHG
jgi:hypothetical protein